MPNNIVDDPTVFPSPVQAPAAGEPRTDTSIALPYQQLSNRTANNKARLDALIPSSAPGYTPALPAGVAAGSAPLLAVSIGAMLSIPAANRFDGMTCVVKDVAVYQFDALSAATSPLTILQPTIDTPAFGRWFLMPGGVLGVANGIQQLDATGRIPVASVRNGIVGYQTEVLAPFNSSLAGPTLQGTPLVLPGLLPGDIIEARYSVEIECSAGAGFSAAVYLQISGPGTTLQAMPGSGSGTPSGTATATAFANANAIGIFTVPPGGAGTWTVGLYTAVSPAGTNTTNFGNPDLVVQAIRP